MPASDPHPRGASRRLLLLTFALLGGCGPEPEPRVPPPAEVAPARAATYVGAGACRDCHELQWHAWRDSHHDLALQTVTGDNVLADLSETAPALRFTGSGAGLEIAPEPGHAPLPARFTFGVEPLQQYVVEAQDGHLQVLPVPWDTRPAALGGQRWYELYPGDYPAGDPMHWQGRANSWNAMCADCHSTGVRKGYDPQARTYATTFAEEDVACEACHGPGSLHVAAAADGDAAADADILALRAQNVQINACAPCHARRSQLAEGFTPDQHFLDFYRPSLLAPHLYHVDGQILDEVYVYGSFLQSRMHRAGVTCTDCHDPHGATLKLGGNATCTQCHNPVGRVGFATLVKADYDSPEHHFHPPQSAGSTCVACHMTDRTYMGVDARRDHSFRVPRPDLSVSLGVPNACSGCHAEQTAQWAADEIESRFGAPPAHVAESLAVARRGDPAAEAELAAIARDPDRPVLVRARALADLTPFSRGYTLDALRSAVRDEPLLRLAATEGAAGLSPESRWRLLGPLLDDELLAIRQGAFASLLPLAEDPAYRARLQPHLSAYLETQTASLDFPETRVNVAIAHLLMGDAAAAERELDAALTLQPSWVPALLNLADLYRGTGRDRDAQPLLERALAVAPDAPMTSYTYGLWLVRQGRNDEALGYFSAAAAVAGDDLRFGYTLALALQDAGRAAEAVMQLESLLESWPASQEVLTALVTMLRDLERYPESLRYAERLLQLRPEDQQLRALRDALRGAV